VAYRWRIRHKLILGMTLVAGIMAILIGGALRGLWSYKAAMHTIDLELVDLVEAQALNAAAKDLAQPISTHTRTLPQQVLQERIPKVAEAITKYKTVLSEIQQQAKHNDFAFRHHVPVQIEALEKGLGELDQRLAAMQSLSAHDPSTPANQNDLLGTAHPIRRAIDALILNSDDLVESITNFLRLKIRESRRDYQHSLILLLGSGVLALVFMIGLLRFFYQGLVVPIRSLELNVNRVAKGDFEHRIELNSGDEMQDFAAALNDMTTRLRDIYADLNQQVNERSRQLVRSERLAGVGFLAAGVAHEINNPLASIAFCSEALERRVADLFDNNFRRDPQEREIIAKYLKMIQEEAFRCKEITQKLLAFSRSGELKRERTDLAQLLTGVLDVVQHLPNSKGKDVIFEPEAPLEAWVNGQEIKQVFLNLIVNALESMDEGGTLTITGTAQHGMLELRFQDTGCGMTSDVLENIFEPFFTRSRTGKGTGLGLSISHRIINQHGGDIEATSAGPNQGSTFVVRLPIDPPAEGANDKPDGLDPVEEFSKRSAARRAA
jgi:signal transduction histidine kinase